MKILWWGRSDLNYSRNRIVLDLMNQANCSVDTFHPLSSKFALLHSLLRPQIKPDLIWVPCFRQDDVISASYWAKRWGVPLIFDPLISSYQKDVFEREKYPPSSKKAIKHLNWEKRIFNSTDLVIADTSFHADFYNRHLDVPKNKIKVLYVGAEKTFTSDTDFPSSDGPFEILFYGSYLQLQGIGAIIDAAKISQDLNAKWTLLGDGDLRPQFEGMASASNNIVFEPWLPYKDLPNRISKAHILLGIFGDTPKAEMVIPNKVYQSMASGRPLITRYSDVYPKALLQDDTIGWVKPNNPYELEQKVRSWLNSPTFLENRGKSTRKLFDFYFSTNTLLSMLEDILNTAKK